MSDPVEPVPVEPVPAVPDPAEPVPEPPSGRDPDEAEPGGAAPGPVPVPVPDALTAGSPDDGRRRKRIANIGIGALAIALVFGVGIGVGRATAPGVDDAAPSLAAASPGAPASPGTSPAPGASPGSSAGASPAPSGIAGLPSDGNRLGRSDARVVVDYWADYQCPFCARFADDIIPQLASRIADGTVALVHRDYAFLDWRAPGTESLDSAMAVRCAGREGRFWPMHDAIYAAQAGENQGAFARDRLAEIAATVGLDATAFEACMSDREVMVEVLDDTAAGTRSGINSTPTVDVNGQRFPGISDAAALLAAIDAAAAGASPAPLPTAPPARSAWDELATDGRTAGDPGAPVTVELWMDYQAAASAPVAERLGPELRSRVADGSIRVVQRDLATLGDESVLAAATVRCVARDGGPAWLVHDALASSGQGPNQGIYTTTSILRFASRIGLEVAALSECLDDPTVAADVLAETADGTASGLATAPGVVVRRGNREVARFTGELDVAKVVAAIDGAKG